MGRFWSVYEDGEWCADYTKRGDALYNVKCMKEVDAAIGEWHEYEVVVDYGEACTE